MHRTAEWTVDVMKAARTEIFEPKVHIHNCNDNYRYFMYI